MASRRVLAHPATHLAAAAVSIGVTAGLGGTAYSTERNRLGAASALFILFGPAVTGFTYLLHFAFKFAASATGSMLLLNASCVLLITVSFSECAVRRGGREWWSGYPPPAPLSQF